MIYLISACLLGAGCRYDGGCRAPSSAVLELMKKATLIPVCPEQLGGLPTPRPPAEIVGEKVINCQGGDVTDAYRRGAEEALRLAVLFGADGIILKDRSPSCGKGEIYDGSFTRRRILGNGMTAALFIKEGFSVYGEQEIARLADSL